MASSFTLSNSPVRAISPVIISGNSPTGIPRIISPRSSGSPYIQNSAQGKIPSPRLSTPGNTGLFSSYMGSPSGKIVSPIRSGTNPLPIVSPGGLVGLTGTTPIKSPVLKPALTPYPMVQIKSPVKTHQNSIVPVSLVSNRGTIQSPNKIQSGSKSPIVSPISSINSTVSHVRSSGVIGSITLVPTQVPTAKSILKFN